MASVTMAHLIDRYNFVRFDNLDGQFQFYVHYLDEDRLARWNLGNPHSVREIALKNATRERPMSISESLVRRHFNSRKRVYELSLRWSADDDYHVVIYDSMTQIPISRGRCSRSLGDEEAFLRAEEFAWQNAADEL